MLESSTLVSASLAVTPGEWPITSRWSTCWGQGFVVQISLSSYSILCPSLVLNEYLCKWRVCDKLWGIHSGITLCELVGTGDKLGSAWAQDDPAEEAQDISVIKLHWGTFSPMMIFMTCKVEKEDDSWGRKHWNGRWNKELEGLVFVQNAWLRKKLTCCVMHGFLLYAKSSESL